MPSATNDYEIWCQQPPAWTQACVENYQRATAHRHEQEYQRLAAAQINQYRGMWGEPIQQGIYEQLRNCQANAQPLNLPELFGQLYAINRERRQRNNMPDHEQSIASEQREAVRESHAQNAADAQGVPTYRIQNGQSIATVLRNIENSVVAYQRVRTPEGRLLSLSDFQRQCRSYHVASVFGPSGLMVTPAPANPVPPTPPSSPIRTTAIDWCDPVSRPKRKHYADTDKEVWLTFHEPNEETRMMVFTRLEEVQVIRAANGKEVWRDEVIKPKKKKKLVPEQAVVDSEYQCVMQPPTPIGIWNDRVGQTFVDDGTPLGRPVTERDTDPFGVVATARIMQQMSDDGAVRNATPLRGSNPYDGRVLS